MRFKKGDYVVYEDQCVQGYPKLVGRVTGCIGSDKVNVSWLNQRFPIISWREATLLLASVVDVLAAVGRKAQEKAQTRMGRRKSGTPIQLTGTQLVTLRLVLAHHLWETPDDDEMERVLRELPVLKLHSPTIHFEGIKTRTIRIPPGRVEDYARAFRLAGSVPHTPPGCGKALLRRADQLERMSSVDRLGSIA